MACDPVQNCKSKRCAQAGVCNCLLVYSDDTQISGSGTGDDPYVIKTPPIQAIADSDGNLITPDANKVVTLPSTISRIISVDTGVEYIPDSQGRVLLPTNAIAAMTFRDELGNILSVETDDIIKFVLDGEEGTITGTSSVNVDPFSKTITFPTMKMKEVENSGVTLVQPSFQGAGSTVTQLVSFDGPYLTEPGTNVNIFPATISLQIYFDGTYYDPGASLDYFTFDIEVEYVSFASIVPIQTNVFWSGDKAGSYQSYSFKEYIYAGNVSGIKNIRLKVTDNQIYTARWSGLKADVQVAMEYI